MCLEPIGIKTQGENVAFLSAACPTYQADTFRSLYRVENGDFLTGDCLGLASDAFDDLGLPEETPVSLALAPPPASLEHVRRKITGEALADSELAAIVGDIAARRYAKMEIAAFLVASAAFMTTAEALGLTRAMAGVGNRMTWDAPMVVDKHCIGGIPGNRTSMIVVPIVTAHGLTIPKTSSRAITSPAGTADTMEVLADVEIGVDDMRRVVKDAHGCLVWGGRVNLSPADDIMISVERPLGIDTPEQMVASILSKKVSAGSSHLLIDMSIGPSAKIRTQHQALQLRKLFEHIGGALGLNVEVMVMDGSQPVGRGIGPVLEARDVMAVPSNDPAAPADLRQRALMLASRLLELDPAVQGGGGQAAAEHLLNSGAALDAIHRIMTAQGPPRESYAVGRHVNEVIAAKTGRVAAIDCYRMARIARLAGAPVSNGAGIDLLKKVGDNVTGGEPIYRIHAALESDFVFASDMARENNGVALA